MASQLLLYPRPPVKFYGVNLKDSEHHAWENSNDNKSELTFKWKEINAVSSESFNDISIAVAQHYRDESKEKVKSIANEIQISGQMIVSDSIIGLQENRLKKIGYISAKENPDDKSTTISINWVSTITDNNVDEQILPDLEQVQLIKATKLGKLEKQLPVAFNKAYKEIPRPTNRESEKGRLKDFVEVDAEQLKADLQNVIYFNKSPKEDQGGTIRLFYGTNRIPTGRVDDKDTYGEETDQLHVGFCEVQIPFDHERGEMERPLINYFEDEEVHVVVKSVKELQVVAFNSDFKDMLNKSPEKHALIFVHGYWTTFEDAARRTAQFGWDIPFDGVSGFFSWPSEGKFAPYPADDARARASSGKFREFLELILDHDELEEVHIIAHSMGSLVLSLSIKDMVQDLAIAPKLEKVVQLIMGAPDIDQAEFRETILPHFNKVARQRTIYASDHDKALQLSSGIRSGLKRLGQSGKNIFYAVGIESVESSNLKTNNSHGYMFRNPSILGDIYFLITQNLPPGKRRLRQINIPNKQYWLFPK